MKSCVEEVSRCISHVSFCHGQYVWPDIRESVSNASSSSKNGPENVKLPFFNKVFTGKFSLKDGELQREQQCVAAAELGRTFHGYHRCSLDKVNCWGYD